MAQLPPNGMPIHEVVPHERVGPVYLGMRKGRVRAALDSEPDPFEKVPGQWVDAFDDAGFHVYYVGNDDPIVDFIEVYPTPGVVFDLYGFDPFALPVAAVLARLRAHQDVIEVEPGCQFELLGRDIALWRSSTSSDRFEALGVGEYGYMPDRAI